MKVVAIVQARMGSSRLPGKVLMDLADVPMLMRVINRTRRASNVDDVVVTTTTASNDNALVQFCLDREIPCFRGSEDDVLDRYYQTAIAYDAGIIVRITADCPLIDPEIINQGVEIFLHEQPNIDYVRNVRNLLPQRSFPRGLDIEVFSFDALERIWQEDTNPAWREHVTLYVQHRPHRFRIHTMDCDADYAHMRWTVDTPEDLAFVRRIYDHFGHDGFTWREVLKLLDQHPDWRMLNEHVKQAIA